MNFNRKIFLSSLYVLGRQYQIQLENKKLLKEIKNVPFKFKALAKEQSLDMAKAKVDGLI